MSFKEIGQKMGVSVGGLARNRMRFQERLKKDRVLLKRFDRIEKILLDRS